VTAQDHHKNATQNPAAESHRVSAAILQSHHTTPLNYQDTRTATTIPVTGVGVGSWVIRPLSRHLTWLMRLSQLLTTLSTFTLDITDTGNFLNKDPATLLVTAYNNRQYQVGPEEEFRFYPLKEAATLYLYQTRRRVSVGSAHGDGTSNAISYYVAARRHLAMGDKTLPATAASNTTNLTFLSADAGSDLPRGVADRSEAVSER